MLPAGEMWSVVIESPSIASARAPVIARMPGGSIVMPSKYGGFFTYVDFSSHAYVSPVGTSSACHCSSPLKTSAYCFWKNSRFTLRATSSCDFLRRRPDVAQEDRPVRADADRLAREVEVHAAGERVRDDERRRREIVEPRVRIDAPLEVAIARQHRRRDQRAALDRRADRLGQRTGVADARRAAVADELEAELVEILLHAGLTQIVGHDLRARRERRLHPRLAS